MHELYELKEKLCEELEKYGGQELTAGSLEVVDKLAHAIKNIDKILEAKEEEEYSMENSYEGGGSYDRGGNRGGGRSYRSYRSGGSYAYARGRGRNARRDSMGRYARESEYSMADSEEMVENLRAMMNEAPDERTRQEFQRFIQKIEGM